MNTTSQSLYTRNNIRAADIILCAKAQHALAHLIFIYLASCEVAGEYAISKKLRKMSGWIKNCRDGHWPSAGSDARPYISLS